MTNDDLRKLFEKMGPLKACKFNTDAFGKFKGSATVVFETHEDAVAAVKKYHNATLDDKPLQVEWERPLTK